MNAADRCANVSVEGVSYTFAGRTTPTLREISFELTAGTSTLLAGRSGSGKSTLLRALAGLIPRHASGQTQGRVQLFDLDTRHAAPAELARRVGLVLQSPDDQLVSLTVAGEVAFGLENLAMPLGEFPARIDDALAEVGLARFQQVETSALSGGQRQRLALAAVLAMQPRLLLLDEPLSQLDPAGACELLACLDELRRAGATIVISEHRLDDVLTRADRVLILDEGRLSADLHADDPRLPASLERAGLSLPDVMALACALGLNPQSSTADLCQSLEPLGANEARATGGFPSTVSVDSTLPDKPAVAHEGSIGSGIDERRVTLRATNLSYSYRHAGRPLWEQVDFALLGGQRVAVVGVNGVGKSTLLKVLAGTLRPSAGEVTYAATALDRGALGFVPQNADLTLFCPTVFDELAFAPRRLGLSSEVIAARVAALSAAFNIDALLDEPPLALSQGQRVRVAFAAAATLHPQVLLLDEPTTGQDPQQVLDLMQSFVDCVCQSQSIGTLVFTTHDARLVQRFADRVLVLSPGRLMAECTPDELLANDMLLSAAKLQKPPLVELREACGASGQTLDELVPELKRRVHQRPGSSP